MTDASTEGLEQAANGAERLDNTLHGVNTRLDTMIDLMGKMPDKISGSYREDLEKIQKEYVKTGDAADKTRLQMGQGFDSSGMLSAVKQGIGPALEEVSGKFANLKKDAIKMKETSETQFGEIGKAAKSLGAIGFMALRKKAISKPQQAVTLRRWLNFKEELEKLEELGELGY